MVHSRTYSKNLDFERHLEHGGRKSVIVKNDNLPTMDIPKNTSKPSDEDEDQNQSDNVNCCMQKICWWSPAQDLLPIEFCNNSSVHGLSFIGRPKAHLSEKIFWTIAFIFGVIGAVLLINDTWQRYYDNPVIVSFQAEEVTTDSIPFPSVTICNMNAFPKSKVQLFESLAQGSGTIAEVAKEYLKYVRSICNSQRSFAEEFKFASRRGMKGQADWNFTISEDNQDEMIDFLLEHTTPCNNLIRLCTLGESKIDCGDIFKPIITDYGKCCTFNILPLPLLMKNPKTVARKMGDVSNPDFNPALGTARRWSQEELKNWSTWDYDVDGFFLQNKSRPHPFRQKRAGMPYGLSILVDANLDDWYCPISDAEGFRFLLHNPLEMPHIEEFASVLDLNKEILIEVHPDVTSADDDIRNINQKDRHCYFPKEMKLDFFQPYTGGNCIDECTAVVLGKWCNCTYFFMPRGNNTNICNMDPSSSDFECVNAARSKLLETMKSECGHCYPLCEDVQYHFETTMSTLQDSMILWLDYDPEYYKNQPEWAKNKMSIVHIFLGSDTVVPKYRKRLYGATDLIANTGGLLGLCLGFSVLSAVEVIYFLTIRAFWQICWKRRSRAKRVAAKFIRSFYSRKATHMQRVIQLDIDQIPVIHQPSWPTFPRPYPNRDNHCDRYVNGIRVNSIQNRKDLSRRVLFKSKIA
ncbi:unnamed protein product [Orchesella dallaii]|uniref:Pickpocket protein 28 n=1 Tax=Orchesella dallaii TaxID=48710 RepID=A0ABP1QNU8_9HEXA